MIPHHHINHTWARPASWVLTAGLAVTPLFAVTAHERPAATATAAAELESRIQTILDDSLQPGAIAWDCCGVDATPTGVNAAVRIPGFHDIVLASGTKVDGSPFDPYAPYPTGTLESGSLVTTVAWQLAEEGILDLDAPIDIWLPDQPNADRVTIGMLANGTHGWANFDAGPLIEAELARHWTLREVLDAEAGVAPLHEPGTFDAETYDAGMTALAYIIEQLTGTSISDLIEARIASPLELDETFVQDGTNQPAGYQHGVASLNGQRIDSSQVPNTAYFTYFGASIAVVSTSTDLLDLLDAFVANDLFTTDRSPGPERFVSARMVDGTVYGVGTPINGYCPCASAAGNGLTVAAMGRRPTSLTTNVSIIRFPDGISVVLHFNSDDVADRDAIWDVVLAVHDVAADTRS
jgi:CubicO group peptidase (beta-lactamase class C family)